MNIYLLEQTENTGYDTYDSCVVIAESEEEARLMLPSNYEKWGSSWSSWASTPDAVIVTFIGKANPRYNSQQIICSSFNAG